jgi:hypothetical protein
VPKNPYFSSLLALLVGAVQAYLLVLAFSFLAGYSPITPWLASLGLGQLVFRAAVFCVDLTFAVVLCLPAAWLLAGLRPKRLLQYLILAVLPCLLWQLQSILSMPPAFLAAPGLLLEALLIATSLPTAIVVVRYLHSRENV